MIDINTETYKKAYMKAIAHLVSDRCKTDPYLSQKCMESDLRLEDVYKYVESEAKKRAVNGCAVLTDSEVLEMAVHCIMEGQTVEVKEPDTDETETIEKPVYQYKPEKKKKPVKLADEISDQLSFDF